MTRMLLLSLFLVFVHVCACAHVCMRAYARFVSLFFFLSGMLNVDFFVLFVFEAVFQITLDDFDLLILLSRFLSAGITGVHHYVRFL